jgi:hypothetical protein
MSEQFERTHVFHAEAHALSGDLVLPFESKLQSQAFVKIPEHGGYLSERSTGYRLESILRYEGAYTQVAGHRDSKPGGGWNTLSTSVVEGLNVLEVVTADRVVSQIATEHPVVGYTPKIFFLGTRFDNLRICGHKVDLDMDLNIFGERAEDDSPYTQSAEFVERVSRQHARIREKQSGHGTLLTSLLERYNRVPESFENSTRDEDTVECSLVNQAEGEYPGHCFGHVIHIPHFGTIYLATLTITYTDFKPGTRIPKRTLIDLKMIDIRMGCATTGNTAIATTRNNGGGKP